MRRFLLTLAACLAALPALAQVNDITECRSWDADDTGPAYCVSLGKPNASNSGTSRGGDYVTPRTAAFKVKTSGSSTTIVSNTASSGSLSFVEAGDLISFVVDNVRVERAITGKTNDDSITVDEAIDLSDGYYYSFRTRVVGTTGTSGEIIVRDLKFFQLSVQVAQADIDTGTIDVTIECRHKYGSFWVIEDKSITEANAGTGKNAFLTRFFHEERWEACRVGVAIADDDADDTGVHAEVINVYLSGDGVGTE